MGQVGIFFLVDDVFLSERVNVEHASINSLFLEYGEHYNFWLNLVPNNKIESKFKTHAYDYFARGRVVFDKTKDCFYLYADKCLSPEMLNKIVELFDLDIGRVKMRRDHHYQCSSCNKSFLDDVII